MKLKIIYGALIAAALAFFAFKKLAPDPWTQKQLMQPEELAARINNGQMNNLVIFDIGPSGRIKNSIEIGPAQEKENLAQLKKKLEKLSGNTEVVIYCGCCPFQHCPNIRPAFELLKDMHFANAKLLNLSRNLKANWIDKGYPMQD